MKCLGILPLIALLLFPVSSALAQADPEPGDAPEWQPFEEAIAAADSSGKKVLVDIYAPWCGWCRKLQKEVYTDDAVQDYLAEHFVVTRLNGDDPERAYSFKGYTLSGMELAQGLGAEGFPTTVFLASNSDYLTRLPGFAEAPEFLQILRYIGTGAFETQSFPEFIEGQKQGSH